MATPKQIAMEMYKKERAAAQWAAEQEENNHREAVANLKRAEEEARVRLQEERELARIRAERALAEQRVREEHEALAAEVEAELQRLRNRSELEILREELAQMRKEMEEMKRRALPLKQDGSLDMRFKTSKMLSIVANNGNLGIDPHFGTGKVLRVTYRVEGNSDLLNMEVEEHQTLSITGPGLNIISASWFTNPRWSSRGFHTAEVTFAVVRHLKEM